MTSLNSSPQTDHLQPLYALEGDALRTFVNMLAPHFVTHDAIDRHTLMAYIAEAEAIA